MNHITSTAGRKIPTPALAILTMALLSSCVVAPGPYYGHRGYYGRPVVVGRGFYTVLPPGYAGSYYWSGGRYYYGGRHEYGRYYWQGRSYDHRYYHDGRYYYGGRYYHGRD